MPEKRRRFQFPKVTLSEGGNELRREIQKNDRDDLRDLESRVSSSATTVSLTAAERAELNDALGKRQDRMEDVASRKKENIFGSTAQQAEFARDAKRGMTTDPGRPVVSTGVFDVPVDDFERATEIHEARPDNARSRDNKQNAPITTDLGKWEENPGEWDYPGVDTFGEPDVSEEQRSRARDAHIDRSITDRRRDSGRLAPITTDAEKYASAPDEYDFPGLDTPDSFDSEFL